ncbi:MAG: PHP domain-containing protein [Deltaproteobacteria bacterium]|nr:PHP domain-containing protein [Deltaproteobacteria bacterium]
MIIDIHCHTRYGSSCSYMSPEEMLQQAVEVGLDGLCITEHDIPWDRDAIKQLSDRFGILVVGGIEASTEYGEVLVFGLHEPIFDIQDIHELHHRVDKAGGIMVAAHPFRGAHGFVKWDPVKGLVIKLEDALNLPILEVVDAVEVFNGMASEWELDLCSTVCDNLKIRGMAGSDAHNVGQVGDCVTILHKMVVSEEEFLYELMNGRYHAWHRVRDRTFPNMETDCLMAER